MEDLIHEVPRLDLSVPSVFKLYRIETGQRVFVFTEVKARAERKAVEPVVKLCQKGLTHDQELAVLEQKWAGQNKAVWGPKMRKASLRMNDAVVDLNTMLTHLHRKAKKGSDLKGALANLSHLMFPEGVGDITKDSYTGKLGKLINIEKALADAPWLAQTRMKTEIVDFFDRFEVYKGEMQTRDWGMSYDTIKKAQAVGQHYLCTLMGLIVGLFPDVEADREMREYLMTPIVDQNESMRRALKGRSKPKNAANDGSGNANGGRASQQGAKGGDGKSSSADRGNTNDKGANNAKTGPAHDGHANREAASESSSKTKDSNPSGHRSSASSPDSPTPTGKFGASKSDTTQPDGASEKEVKDESGELVSTTHAKNDEPRIEKGKPDAA